MFFMMHKQLLIKLALALVCITLVYVYLYIRVEENVVKYAFTKRFSPLLEAKSLSGDATGSTIDRRVLIVTGSSSSKKTSSNVNELVQIFETNRYKYKIVESSWLNRLKLSSPLTNRSFYSLVIVDYPDFVHLPQLESLIEHCRKFRIGIIYLTGQTFTISSSSNCTLNYFESKFFKTTKINKMESVLINEAVSLITNALVFIKRPAKHTLDHNSYTPIVKCNNENVLVYKTSDHDRMLREIIVYANLNLLLPTLILDLLEFASYGLFNVDLTRYVQIDIDDIFVARTGIRMKPQDVYALEDFQNYLNSTVFVSNQFGFKFNLGFSGYYFKSGSSLENLADQLLIEKRHVFNWFDHTWSHLQAHLLNESTLKEQINLNHQFAAEKGLVLNTSYAVSPHHSGIYPVYDHLYEYWSKLGHIKATSTESYPHLRPKHMRRGFMYKNIMVAPRQACGIFSHTNFIDNYPSGIASLDANIYGGEIFRTIVYSPLNIYMTHMSNYGNDRLGLYVFKRLFDHLIKWTNFKLVSLPPLQMVQKYFEIYPQDMDPLWTNYCSDERHLNQSTLNQTYCNFFPKFIILGPQKTGTTALYSFLKQHPNIRSNEMTSFNFEETQFFSTQYHRGVEWYLKLFKSNVSLDESKNTIFFEKSANYFSEPKSPLRIKTLLPDVKLIIISIDPIQRAYSWYQHVKFHADEIATNYSFYDVITVNTNSESIRKQMIQLRDRCLQPGLYHKHLKNWLKHFSLENILILDGDVLKQKPYVSLDLVQKFLTLNKVINYEKRMVYDRKKGFYCMLVRKNINSKTPTKVCLGSSKGRIYDIIDDRSKTFLREFYSSSNRKFFKLLKEHKFDIPRWLMSNLE